jgi:hypothetical protein
MTATVNGAALAVHGLPRRERAVQVPVTIGSDEQIGFEDLMNPARSAQSG